MHTIIRCLVAVTVAGSFVVTAAPAAATPIITGPPPSVGYAPPVDAPVTDPFRPPTSPYGPGNRGLEFGTAPGTVVGAAADGTVTYAGVVAGRRWVTIRHADGVRTTYGPLDTISVAVGGRVARGQPIGTTTDALTFTARIGEAYVDPASLFDGGPPRVRLVPEPLDRPGVHAHHGLSIPGADALLSALDWEWRHVDVIPATALAHTAGDVVLNGVDALQRWNENRDHCTSSTAIVSPPTERRFALLVGGLGSSTTSAAITDIDTNALGYDGADVLRFSYSGGRVPTSAEVAPELAALPVHGYSPRDTVGDLRAAGHRLAELLAQMGDAVPSGAPIDVLAHSQGGLVTRVALHELAATRPEVLDHVQLVVTLATPHQGADLAGLVQAADTNSLDPGLFDVVRGAIDLPIAPDDPAVTQLAPGSEFMHELASEPIPSGVRFVSVAASGDAVVPSPRAELDGATNVVVDVNGLSAHDHLPGSSPAAREIALAIGLGPACESAVGALVQSTEGTLIQNGEDFVAAELG